MPSRAAAEGGLLDLRYPRGLSARRLQGGHILDISLNR
jgi:hypothetical protein